jgi:chromosome partitioning protein
MKPTTGPPLRVAIVSVKPGVGKTTTGLFLCQSFHEMEDMELPPLLIDADKGESALDWMQDAGGLAFPVVGQHVTTLHRSAPDLEPGRGAVVVDVPQIEDHEGIGRGALAYADVWLFPVAPAGIEVRRTMRKLRTKLDQARELREQVGRPRDPLAELVLFTRTNKPFATKTGPDADYRQALTGQGYTVMDTVIAFHDDLYRQAYGNEVSTAGTTYPQAAAEIVTRWKKALA